MGVGDTDIMQAIKGRLEEGFRMLMAKFKEPVYWHIRRLVVSHDDAQDATQETFVRVFRSFSQFRGDCSFTSWIYRIATHEAFRIIDQRKTDECSLENTIENAGTILADNYVDYSDLEAVKLQKAILSLPPKQQLAFNLRYYDDLEYDEIAEIMESTTANVKMNYHLAKDKIIKYMNSNV